MSWKKAIIPVVVVVPFLVVLALSFGQDPHEVPSMLKGRQAPSFELQNLAGQTVTLASLAGKPVVLNFWSTWCEPCKLEHDLLQNASRYYADKVHFVGVVYQDQEDKVRRYLRTHANYYTQLLDPGSVMAIDYGVAGVPESFILDAAGSVRHKQTGVMSGQVLRRVLDALVSEGN